MINVYLAGKITGLTMEEATRWRIKAKELLKDVAIVKDPTAFQPPTPKTIVVTNKLQILESHVVLAEFEHLDVSIGTVGEIVFATEHKIPVVVWGRLELIQNPWIQEHSIFQALSLEDAVDFIKYNIVPCYGGGGL